MLIRKIAFLGLVVLALVALHGCKKSRDGVGMKQVNDAFVAAGFKLDAFHPAEAARFSAATCAAGNLDGVDTLVCEYPSAPDSETGALARRAGEDWVATAVTGAVLTNGHTLLAVADRAHADPHGKTIHKITQAYQHTK